MANDIGWGQGAINNTINWGQACKNNTIDFGVCESYSGETNITGDSGWEDVTSFYLDSVDDKLITRTTWDTFDNTNYFSISMWIKVTDLSATRTIWNSQEASNYQTSISINTLGRVSGAVTGSSSNWTRSADGVITVGNWHHIVMTLDNTISRYSKLKIYVDNSRAGATSNFYNAVIGTGTFAYIGGSPGGSAYGHINEIAVWGDYTLTPAEVTAIYNNGIPTNLEETQGLTRMPLNWVRSENATWNGREFVVDNYDDASSEQWLSLNMAEDQIQNDVPTFNTKSLDLDGIDDRAEGSSDYLAISGDSQATFSLWFKLEKDAIIQYPLSCYDTVNLRFIFGIRLQRLSPTDARVWFYSNTAANSDRSYANLGSVTNDGAWHHLMIGVDFTQPSFSETRFFLDGVELTRSGYHNSSVITSFNGLLTIGNRDNTYSGYYGGYIDEVAIWGGQDLSDDVATIYNGGVPNNLNDNGLTAPTTYYRCGDNDTSPTIIDRGTSGYNLTMTNFSTFSNDVLT